MLASAQVQEWSLVEHTLEQRTTLALERYYTVVRPDSLRLRYIGKNAGQIPYVLRGHRTVADTLGQLLSIRLGQLTLATVTNLRIALGDDLYTDLLLSRHSVGVKVETIGAEDDFGYESWDNEYAWIIALDRFDYRFNRSLGLFAEAGAPESNLYFWNDGTFRIGLESPDWEFALLLPYGSGATPFGFLQERLLAPGFGAAGRARLANLTGRIRFATLSDAAFDSPRVAPRVYLHSLSSQLTWQGYLEGPFGLLRYDAGIGYEEFSAADRDTAGEAVAAGRVRRLSPVVDLAWIPPGGNVQLGAGVADIALRTSITARFTDWLWLEMRYVSNDLFRSTKPFEHASYLFITPRLKF
jgi:hypothetical protein